VLGLDGRQGHFRARHRRDPVERVPRDVRLHVQEFSRGLRREERPPRGAPGAARLHELDPRGRGAAGLRQRDVDGTGLRRDFFRNSAPAGKASSTPTSPSPAASSFIPPSTARSRSRGNRAWRRRRWPPSSSPCIPLSWS
jgi:hypothetical protein